MRETITTLISAVINIAAIILRAVNQTAISNILEAILPEINIAAVAILWFFGYQRNQQIIKKG